MANKTIKLVANLTFDENKESDIVNMIEYLNSHHKTGQFLSGLIRLAMDCPEIVMKNTNGEIDLGPSMKKITVDGLSTLRRDFMNSLNSKVDKLWEQVTDIRKKALQVYTLAQMNKFVGIEGKSENTLRASFVIERQLSDLQKSLGTLINDKQFIDERLKKSKDFSDETLEYIITTYDGIVAEIKNQFNAVNNMTRQTVEEIKAIEPVNQTEIKLAEQIVKTEAKPEEAVVKPVELNTIKAETEVKTAEPVVSSTVDTSTNTEEDIIDFGSDPEDLDLLSNFFGE